MKNTPYDYRLKTELPAELLESRYYSKPFPSRGSLASLITPNSKEQVEVETRALIAEYWDNLLNTILHVLAHYELITTEQAAAIEQHPSDLSLKLAMLDSKICLAAFYLLKDLRPSENKQRNFKHEEDYFLYAITIIEELIPAAKLHEKPPESPFNSKHITLLTIKYYFTDKGLSLNSISKKSKKLFGIKRLKQALSEAKKRAQPRQLQLATKIAKSYAGYLRHMENTDPDHNTEEELRALTQELSQPLPRRKKI